MTRISYPSEVRALPEAERRAAWDAFIAEGNRQDTLEGRISAGVALTPGEVASMVETFGKRCHSHTRDRLRRALAAGLTYSAGCYGRVLFEDGEASYCAGQDYPAEVRRVRETILRYG